MTATAAQPIPCTACTHLIHPGDRALILTSTTAYHQACFRAIALPGVGHALSRRIERRGRCRIGRVA